MTARRTRRPRVEFLRDYTDANRADRRRFSLGRAEFGAGCGPGGARDPAKSTITTPGSRAAQRRVVRFARRSCFSRFRRAQYRNERTGGRAGSVRGYYRARERTGYYAPTAVRLIREN